MKLKSNFRIARYKLRECKQTDSEPVDVFVKRLRTILAECKYQKEQQEVHLLDAMIFGIKLKKVQSQLLQHDETLTVDQALMLARTEEATRQQIEELRGITKPVDMIRKPAGHAGKTRPRQCPQAKNAPQEKLSPRVPPKQRTTHLWKLRMPTAWKVRKLPGQRFTLFQLPKTWTLE